MRTLVLVLVAAGASHSGPTIARAFETCAVLTARPDGTGTVACEESLGCASMEECRAGLFPTAYCLDLDDENPGTTYCQPPCATVFFCDPEEVCPVLSGIGGECWPSSVEGGRSICRYPPGTRRTYCVDLGAVISAETFFKCHHVPGTDDRASSSYDFGDCDGDGCPNIDDHGPCDPLTIPPGCGPRELPDECAFSIADGGVASGDGGVMASRDGGTISGDAAPPPMDGAVARDAGASVIETAALDWDYRGSGGCTCDAEGGEPPAIVGLVFLVWLTTRSRARAESAGDREAP